MLDFKIRSRLFRSFTEAKHSAQEDFDRKLPVLYTEGDARIRTVTVMNPAFVIIGSAVIDGTAGLWDSNCCGAVFFCEDKVDEVVDENDELDHSVPSSWMFKYEIFFSDDAIEISKNGEYAFQDLSTYH